MQRTTNIHSTPSPPSFPRHHSFHHPRYDGHALRHLLLPPGVAHCCLGSGDGKALLSGRTHRECLSHRGGEGEGEMVGGSEGGEKARGRSKAEGGNEVNVPHADNAKGGRCFARKGIEDT